MSKDRSLKPKRQFRVNKSSPGQMLASERKKRNRQVKEVVSPEEAHKRYQVALLNSRGITREYRSAPSWCWGMD